MLCNARKCTWVLVLAVLMGLTAPFPALADLNDGLVGCWSFDEGGGTYITDESGEANHGTLVNDTPSTWISGVRGTALYFPGITGNDSVRVEIPDSASLDISTSVSFSAWIQCDDIHRDAPILAKEDYGSHNSSYWFGAHGVNESQPGNFGVLLSSTDDTGWDLWDRDQGDVSVTSYDGEWTHVVSTWDGATTQHYLNGQLLEDVSGTLSGVLNETSVLVTIGVNSGRNSSSFLGAIDELRLYDRALSSGEVQLLYRHCPEGLELYVDDDAPPDGDGLTWDTAYNDLQDALADVCAVTEIRVAAGTYVPGATRDSSFALINGVTVAGGYAGYGAPDPDERDTVAYETILSGDIGVEGDDSDNCYHVFYHTADLDLDETALLDGCTITNGNANGSGYLLWGGGGMFNDEGSGSPTMINCTFTDNSAGQQGGAMFNRYCTPRLIDCTVSGNTSSDQGGGMYNWYASPELTNCAFSENVSDSDGGGMYNYACDAVLVNCVFSTNMSASRGGAVFNDYNSGLVFTNCILWGNTAPEGPQIHNHNSSATVTFSCIEGSWPGEGNIDDDPMLIDVVDGDLHVSFESPCIDAGDSDAVPEGVATDLDGNPRFVDDPCTDDTGVGYLTFVDMGAYEFHSPPDFDGDGIPDCLDDDIDNDGVLNVDDVCDYTPGGVTVDEEGRPIGDLDLDCDVDLDDFAVMQANFTGPLP